MRKAKKCISLIMAAMLAVSMLASTSAFADTQESESQSHATGRIYVDNAASGGYSASEESGEATVPRKATDITYPSSYSSVDKGYITSVKNQGEYGTCWAQSAAASAEASLIKNNGYTSDTNLSELHLAYYMYNSAYDALGMLSGDSTKIGGMYSYRYSFLDLGGSNSFTPFVLARWTGLVDEIDNPQYAYSKANSSFKVSDNSQAYSLDVAHLNEAYWVSPSDLDDMKYMITKYGAGTIAYYASSTGAYNESTASYCYKGNSYPNHEVTVVGWDDNYSRNNFTSYYRPSKDGAWLVKNSWDTDWGIDGYFWLSYEDTSLCSDVASFYAFEANDNYDNNYQYDGSSIYDYEEVSGAAQEANVFTADSNEYLKAVSFWTAQQNVSYSVQIYTGLTDASDPTSGKKMLSEEIQGTQTYAGYHTVKVPNSIYLNAGEKYSVVVKLSANSDDQTYFFIDKSDSSEQWVIFTNKASAGQSFIKAETGSTWTDKSKSGINYRIKAFTDEADPSAVVTTDTSSTDTVNDAVSDSDVYYYSDSESYDWWSELYEMQSEDAYKAINDVSELKDGDKIVLVNSDLSCAVMPFMSGFGNTLAVMDAEYTDSFDSDYAWTVRIENGNMYLEAENGKRLVSYDKNTVALEDVGSSLLFKDGSTDGTFTLYATGSQRYLKYNEAINGYRFYKTADETSEFVVYKKAENKLHTKVVAYGDITGDGKISMLDVVATQKLIANLADTKTVSLKMLADLDADGEVTMQDVVAMQMHIAGLSLNVPRASKTATLVFG